MLQPARAIEIDRQGRRLAQLVEVLRVAEGRALVEPLGAQRLGGDADGGAAVLERDGGADHGLGALGDGDDAEPERQAQLEVALEALDLLQSDLGICGHVCGHRAACGQVSVLVTYRVLSQGCLWEE